MTLQICFISVVHNIIKVVTEHIQKAVLKTIFDGRDLRGLALHQKQYFFYAEKVLVTLLCMNTVKLSPRWLVEIGSTDFRAAQVRC